MVLKQVFQNVPHFAGFYWNILYKKMKKYIDSIIKLWFTNRKDGKIMDIAIRYQSRNGNTKAVAEVIAQTLGINAYTIDEPINKSTDLLIIGGGVYMWDIDINLKAFLEKLDPNNVKCVAAFTTAGGMDKTKNILSIIRTKNINVKEDTLGLKLGIKNHSALGGKGTVKLNEKQINIIKEFVNKIIKLKDQ
jgi:flavodoxin